MHGEPPVALPEEVDGGLVVRVNFGLLAGRQATAAELEELGRELSHQTAAVSVISEERFELSETSEAEVHQVRIELDAQPIDEALREAVVRTAERWARACAGSGERHADVIDV
ncbi:MAG: hypothetical protein ABR583_09645 [Gaiellaceae bacterium]